MAFRDMFGGEKHSGSVLGKIAEKYGVESGEFDTSETVKNFQNAIAEKVADRLFQAQKADIESGGSGNVEAINEFQDNDVNRFYAERLETIVGDISTYSRDMMKTQIRRMEELQASLADSSATEKDFLLKHYEDSLQFMRKRQEDRFTTAGLITEKLGDVAERYLDLRSIYAGLVDNNPIMMGLMQIGSDMFSKYRERKKEQKELVQRDHDRILMADKIERDKMVQQMREEKRQNELDELLNKQQKNEEKKEEVLGGDTPASTPNLDEDSPTSNTSTFTRESVEKDAEILKSAIDSSATENNMEREFQREEKKEEVLGGDTSTSSTFTRESAEEDAQIIKAATEDSVEDKMEREFQREEIQRDNVLFERVDRLVEINEEQLEIMKDHFDLAEKEADETIVDDLLLAGLIGKLGKIATIFAGIMATVTGLKAFLAGKGFKGAIDAGRDEMSRRTGSKPGGSVITGDTVDTDKKSRKSKKGKGSIFSKVKEKLGGLKDKAKGGFSKVGGAAGKAGGLLKSGAALAGRGAMAAGGALASGAGSAASALAPFALPAAAIAASATGGFALGSWIEEKTGIGKSIGSGLFKLFHGDKKKSSKAEKAQADSAKMVKEISNTSKLTGDQTQKHDVKIEDAVKNIAVQPQEQTIKNMNNIEVMADEVKLARVSVGARTVAPKNISSPSTKKMATGGDSVPIRPLESARNGDNSVQRMSDRFMVFGVQ